MKYRTLIWPVLLCLLVSLCGCGSGDTTSAPSFETAPPPTVTDRTESPAEPQLVTETAGGNILIAYFSWADNTNVTDVDASVQSALSHYASIGDRNNYSEADAVSSASVVVPGNTAKMAQWIQEYVGGDLFPITVADPYPDNYDECLDRAADEKAENARPELAEHLDNMEDYDVIFLGFPNWWSTAPMAVFSFIEEYDLSGKTIVPFCAHGTGGIAASVRDITAALPDSATVMEVLGVYRADINYVQPTVNQWLENLGFAKQEVSEMANGERKIKMTVDGQEVIITLYDTTAGNALYEQLPLELTFEDYNSTEKISHLPETLPTQGDVDECDPDVGDFCLYTPWGNLCIFYRDFRYSQNLIQLGRIDSGMEVISAQTGNFFCHTGSKLKLEVIQ